MALSIRTKPHTPLSTTTAGKIMISLVVFLFFARGFSTVLLYALVPRLKSLFDLSYAEVMLSQSCFFLGYFIFSLPAAFILARVGYIRAIILGLTVMMVGCLTFSLASMLGQYLGFLGAFFVIAAGITLLQVAANPFIAVLGPPQSSHSRLTLAQAFNSLGTTVGPLVGAWLILDSVNLPPHSRSAGTSNMARIADWPALQLPFLVIAGALALTTLIFWFYRKYPVPATTTSTDINFGLRLLSNRRFLFGAIAIFLYVGAEVSIGSMMINYLTQATVLSISVSRAGQLLSLYWGGAMCGRFLGSGLLRIVPPGMALSTCAVAATILAILSSSTTGTTAAATIIAIGLCNSIMFPTIFALALDGLGDNTPEGSGVLCMAIVGGAVVPEIAGIVADASGLAYALLIPALCYVWIALYGAYVGRSPVHSVSLAA